jgi:hypothetical protein
MRIRLGLLAVVALTAWGHPAAAKTTVADSGFRPSRDGYAFANYLNRAGRPNLGGAEMRRLFGDAVCAGFDRGQCVLSPPALAWMQQQNASMAGGHCVGLSVTALLFWSQLSHASQFGSARVSGLKIAGNSNLSREVAYGHVFQVLDSVISAQVSSSPRDVVQTLISGLGRDGQLYTLAVLDASGLGGHAVTPYAVQQLGGDRYAILVYDNNFPRRTRQVLVNIKANTWSFDAAVNPHAPASHFRGDANTQTLLLLPARPGLGVQPCPFCSPAVTAAAARASAARAAGVSHASLQAIRLQTSGRVGAHLRITDAKGRRIGFVRGRLVNEIPGARIVPVFAGTTKTWLERIEPQYEVPSGTKYRITLTAGRERGRHARSKATVTVLEAGFVAAARSIVLKPRERARLRLSADGHTLAFARARGGREPMLVVGNAAPGAPDYQWNIRNQRRATGKWVPVSLDVADRKMTFTGGGRYDLSMYAIEDKVSVFTHHGLHIGAGVTAVLDYANWTDGQPMPLTLIKNGHVIVKRLLEDQPSSDTGSQFKPSADQPTGPTGGPPHTTIDNGPPLQSNSATASFAFGGTGSAGFECKLNDAPFAPCTSPHTYNRLSDGTHTFTVQGIDNTGAPVGSPAEFTWVVDSTGPTLAPTLSPAAIYLGALATATPNATDAGTGVASQSCDLVPTSPAGDQTVRCTATDNTGNTTTVFVHYTVQYLILGMLPPAPNSKWKAGQTVPIKVTLADADGQPIPDSVAAALAAACAVTFSASGAQTQSPTCMTYDGAQFIFGWKVGDECGEVTLAIRVDYGTGTPTTLTRTITVIG